MHILDASDFAHGMQRLLEERVDLQSKAKRQREFLDEVCAALGFSKGAVPRRYLKEDSLEKAVLAVLRDAKVNAYQVAFEASGDGDQ